MRFVVESPFNRLTRCEPAWDAEAVQDPTQPEIRERRFAPIVNEHVLWLDVGMGYGRVSRMEMFETVSCLIDLPRKVSDRPRGKPPLTETHEFELIQSGEIGVRP